MSEEAQKAEYVDLLQEARKIDDALAAVSSKLKTLGNAPCESPIRSGLEPDFLQIKQTGRRGNPLRDSAERGGFLDFVRRRAQSNSLTAHLLGIDPGGKAGGRVDGKNLCPASDDHDVEGCSGTGSGRNGY